MIVSSWICKVFGHKFWAGVIRSRPTPNKPNAYGWSDERIYSHAYRRCQRCGEEGDV